MRIALIDFMGYRYDAGTPEREPIGGSQSAVCYLARALVAQGCAVTLFNGSPEPGESHGIPVRPVEETVQGALAGFQLAIVSGGAPAAFPALLAQRPEPRPILVYWTGHMTDQPASRLLADPTFRDFWDGFAFVSRWQAGRFAAEFAIPATRIAVMGNAAAPAFEEVARSGPPPLAERLAAPVLAYTSTPFRGLDLLLAAFPLIREEVPEVRLRIYSSMAVYQVPGDRDPYAPLYRRAMETPGVEYIGAVSQPRLAREMREVTALAYPNTFEETYCIAALEAMAAGCLVASCDRGALPETTAGFGILMKAPPEPARHAEQFADMAIWLLTAARQDPAPFEARQRGQLAHVLATGTWTARAREWLAWMASGAFGTR